MEGGESYGGRMTLWKEGCISRGSVCFGALISEQDGTPATNAAESSEGKGACHPDVTWCMTLPSRAQDGFYHFEVVVVVPVSTMHLCFSGYGSLCGLSGFHEVPTLEGRAVKCRVAYLEFLFLN